MHRLHKRCLQTKHHICRQTTERKRICARTRAFSHGVRFRCRCGPKHIGIVSTAANQNVVARISGQRIISHSACQPVGQRVAGDYVVAPSSNKIFKKTSGIQLKCQIGIDRLKCGKIQIDRYVLGGRQGKIQRVGAAIIGFFHNDLPQIVVGIELVQIVSSDASKYQSFTIDGRYKFAVQENSR